MVGLAELAVVVERTMDLVVAVAVAATQADSVV
jgi:hypothetical protein